MQDNGFALTEFVDLADHNELFELLDNERVYALSHQGITDGFSSVKAISRSTGIENAPLIAASALSHRHRGCHCRETAVDGRI